MSARRLIVEPPHRAEAAIAPARAAGLDWLRAGAALAVVALHAGMPYMKLPLPQLRWCVSNKVTSEFVGVLGWAINGCVMPLFFILAGYLASGLWARKTPGQFVIHRSKRLLIPLLIGVAIALPADMYVWLFGWFTEGLIPFRKILSIKLPEPLSSQFWGVAHLWYLECLWMLSAAAAAVLLLRQRWSEPCLSREEFTPLRIPQATGFCRWHPSRPGIIGLWALASGLILAWEPEILIGFRQRWCPDPAMLLFYATYFAAGWSWPKLRRQPTGIVAARLLVAATMFPALIVGLRHHAEEPSLVLTIAFSLFSWLAAAGLFELALSHGDRETPEAVAFVAEGSFWMYLVHHPIAALVQLALVRSTLNAELRFATAFTVATGVSLASYAVFVRRTWLGRLLNGQGSSQAKRSREVEPVEVPATQAA